MSYPRGRGRHLLWGTEVEFEKARRALIAHLDPPRKPGPPPKGPGPASGIPRDHQRPAAAPPKPNRVEENRAYWTTGPGSERGRNPFGLTGGEWENPYLQDRIRGWTRAFSAPTPLDPSRASWPDDGNWNDRTREQVSQMMRNLSESLDIPSSLLATRLPRSGGVWAEPSGGRGGQERVIYAHEPDTHPNPARAREERAERAAMTKALPDFSNDGMDDDGNPLPRGSVDLRIQPRASQNISDALAESGRRAREAGDRAAAAATGLSDVLGAGRPVGRIYGENAHAAEARHRLSREVERLHREVDHQAITSNPYSSEFVNGVHQLLINFEEVMTEQLAPVFARVVRLLAEVQAENTRLRERSATPMLHVDPPSDDMLAILREANARNDEAATIRNAEWGYRP